MLRATLMALWIALPAIGVKEAYGEERFTANTLRLGKGEASPPASIDRMAWLAGTWTGEGLGGGYSEEIWSASRNGVMMGVYRLFKDGQPQFYELLTLGTQRDSLILRLKHFHADLRGWEDRDEAISLPLVALRDGRIYFDGLTFERRAGDEITIYLAIENAKDRTAREEIFRYTRSPSHAKVAGEW